jgi:hypothetical protein
MATVEGAGIEFIGGGGAIVMIGNWRRDRRSLQRGEERLMIRRRIGVDQAIVCSSSSSCRMMMMMMVVVIVVVVMIRGRRPWPWRKKLRRTIAGALIAALDQSSSRRRNRRIVVVVMAMAMEMMIRFRCGGEDQRRLELARIDRA